MEKFNRAERRHQLARIKAKRKGYWYGYPAEMTPKRLGMVSQTPALCSCHMCGNPRKFFGDRTLQELVHLHELKENHDALGN
jgi:hypothetical protein